MREVRAGDVWTGTVWLVAWRLCDRAAGQGRRELWTTAEAYRATAPTNLVCGLARSTSRVLTMEYLDGVPLLDTAQMEPVGALPCHLP